METKDKGNIAVEKGNKKQIKCHRFIYKPINRELMVHEDIDNKARISVSDALTGFRLLKLQRKITEIQLSDVTEELEKFVKHYTKEKIVAELERIENEQSQGKKI